MSKSLFRTIELKIAQDAHFLYWLWQIGFWVLVCLISFITLTTWYQQFEWYYTLHTILQSIVGFLLTQALVTAFKALWNKPIFFRLMMVLMLVLLAAKLWTIFRIQAFEWMTYEENVWADFGGWYFGSIFIFLCWAGVFHGIRYYRLLESEHRSVLAAEAETKNEQMQRVQAQAIARDAQIKMLRYQLNPHFLCNTLNAINSLVESELTEKAQEMTVKLSKFLRYSLDNNPDIKVALEHELKALNLYLDIEKSRFGQRLQLEFDIADSALPALVPSLLVQPIIENSMKHAIAKSEQGGTIGIVAKVENNYLEIEIYDTGSGIKVAKSKIQSNTGRGVGLRNTDERLKALYGDNFSLEAEVDPSGGLRTFIRIPFEESENM